MEAAMLKPASRTSHVEIVTRDPRWTSTVARDTAEDGKFFHSVRTPGVYCRPACAARPLAREASQ